MKKYFINLFEYDSWANAEILNSLLTIDDPPGKAMSLMSHIINARTLWLYRMKKITSPVGVWQLYPNSEISEALKKSSSDLIEFLKNISENETGDLIEYTNSKGERFSSTVKDILSQLALHSPYHRGQIILLIKPLVASLPVTDYIHFVRVVKK